MNAPARGAKGSIQGRYRMPRSSEACGMDREESEYLIVPAKEGKSPRTTLWREGGTGSNRLLEGKMVETSSSTGVSTKLQKIAEMSNRSPGMVITTLAHHIDVEFLKQAYQRTRKDGATGIDNQTAEQYGENLTENLTRLHDRLKKGEYKAPPVRRAYIPKADRRKKRPIGIPTFEDKVLQRAVTMILEAVYEQDFLDCSYGFRPGRSAHQALQALWDGLMEMHGGWVIEVDIKSYFDNINHQHLRSFLDKRVRDGVIRKVIDKWLNAGVMEKGSIEYPEAGSPQGGVISPMLANIYLHEVLDVWFAQEVKPRLEGKAFLIRFADDCLIACSTQRDADRIMAVLEKRFAKYGLELNRDKTRVFDFRRPRHDSGNQRKDRPNTPRSFNMLGFTLYWGRSRKGFWIVKRKTAGDRLSRSLRNIALWCKSHRHRDLRWQHEQLSRKVRGHYAYFGFTGNQRALRSFLHQVQRIWCVWLSRRSQRRWAVWESFHQIYIRFPLPAVVIVHRLARP